MPDRQTKTTVLLTSVEGDLLNAVVSALTIEGAAPVVARTLEDLRQAKGGTLVSFGTSVIVPRDVLARFEGRAFNVHAASPDYPGRDPHHFAIYDGVARYGATFHVMTARVDDGPILDVEWFDVPPGCAPGPLLDLANAASARLLRRHGRALAEGQPIAPTDGVSWGGRKRTRGDFRAMCTLTPEISAEEFRKRFAAFDGGAYDNLTLELHGWTFRIDKSAGQKG